MRVTNKDSSYRCLPLANMSHAVVRAPQGQSEGKDKKDALPSRKQNIPFRYNNTSLWLLKLVVRNIWAMFFIYDLLHPHFLWGFVSFGASLPSLTIGWGQERRQQQHEGFKSTCTVASVGCSVRECQTKVSINSLLSLSKQFSLFLKCGFLTFF